MVVNRNDHSQTGIVRMQERLQRDGHSLLGCCVSSRPTMSQKLDDKTRGLIGLISSSLSNLAQAWSSFECRFGI